VTNGDILIDTLNRQIPPTYNPRAPNDNSKHPAKHFYAFDMGATMKWSLTLTSSVDASTNLIGIFILIETARTLRTTPHTVQLVNKPA
jgi:hypothetical protein